MRLIDLLSQEYIQNQITYCPTSGNFFKKDGISIGSKSTENRQYSTIWIILPNGKRHRFDAHRLAYLWVYGNVPNQIDHINGNKSDNRINNLRSCTDSENRRNSKKRKDNTSGYKGVSYFKKREKWNSRIGIILENGSRRYKNLGYFNTKEEAYSAYCEAANLYHKEFKRLS
jgi:hypothetical protein